MTFLGKVAVSEIGMTSALSGDVMLISCSRGIGPCGTQTHTGEMVT